MKPTPKERIEATVIQYEHWMTFIPDIEKARAELLEIDRDSDLPKLPREAVLFVLQDMDEKLVPFYATRLVLRAQYPQPKTLPWNTTEGATP